MASIEDKILNGPQANYCDSDEGEHEEDRNDREVTRKETSSSRSDFTGIPHGQEFAPPGKSGPGNAGSRQSQNTGPKGVLRDWELYKEHEEQQRLAKEADLIRMVKATSITCQTEAEEAKAKEVVEKLAEEMEGMEDLDELMMSDKVLEQFMKKRMEMMLQGQSAMKPKFSTDLLEINNGDVFLKVIDESDPRVPVLIHMYEDKFPECRKMNDCLSSLTSSYPHVQFCKMRADAAGLSRNFKAKGVPALLVYKGGSLIGNFVQLKDEFGVEFYPGDVENFLIENGMIEDRNNVPALIAAAKSLGK